MLFFTPFETVHTQEDEKSINFDIRRDTYVSKEPIFIDGYVNSIKYPPYINIRISGSDGLLVENVYVFPSKDNYFFYHTKSFPSWEIPMTYTVKVTYAGYSLTKNFDLVDNSKDYDPQSVESLQKEIAKINIKNHNYKQKIKDLEETISQKQKEMDSMYCYKVPV